MGNALSGLRTARLFSSTVLDQMLLSGANFAVALLLIRFSTDRDYGLYVLLQSAILLLTTSQGAWLMGPLATLTAHFEHDRRLQAVSWVKTGVRRVLAPVALLLLFMPMIAGVAGLIGAKEAAVATIGVVACWMGMRREFLRGVLLMYVMPNVLLKADAMYAVVLLAGIAVAITLGGPVAVVAACAVALAAFAGEFVAHQRLKAEGAWIAGRVDIWPRLRGLGNWALLGSAIYWLMGQSYSYLLATRLDLKAVAEVNAIRALVNPAFILTIGVTSLLSSMAPRWYVQLGIRALARRLVMVTAAVCLLECGYLSLVWFGRDWLVQHLFHKTIEDREALLLLWGGVVAVGVFRDVLQCGLTAMGRFRSLAWQVGVSAAVAVVLMWQGIAWWGARAVLIGQIVGEVVNLAGIIFLLARSVADEGDSRSGPAV